MKKITIFAFLALSFNVSAQTFSPKEIKALKKEAAQITIVKDKYGVPHVYTKTDEQAVFGMSYVQCEEFFDKLESSLISRLGRQSEIDGEAAIYKDLWTRMYTDSTRAKALYKESPKWLQKLCDGFAGGVNLYLITHPDKKTKLIKRMEPWMSLMNNVPALGGSNIDEAGFAALYSKKGPRFTSYLPSFEPDNFREPAGSNGWAIAPSRTKSKNAMILINPHSEFYGRIEIQVTSEEGLNSYGAPFIGQFSLFQGFNEYLGWMHPVSLSDGKDLYAEMVEQKDGKYYYKYNGEMKAVDSTEITIPYKKGNEILTKKFTVYRTHHGPVVSILNKKWVSLKTIDGSIDLLAMHWEKMKAKNFDQFKASMDKRVMTGSNVMYADRDGNIAYWHGNFVPKKDPSLNWKRPVDGSTDATEWKGTYSLDEIPNYKNPANGWLQNCNSTVLYATGKYDSTMAKKPEYMFPDGHTPRAMDAIRVLDKIQDATMDDIIAAAHDTYLPNAARFIPNLIYSYTSSEKPMPELAGPIEVLKKWDFRTDTSSIATTLAVMWIEKVIEMDVAKLEKPYTNEERYSVTNGAAVSTDNLTARQMTDALRDIVAELTKDFGTWKVAWGTVNRYQRNPEGELGTDSKKSWPLPATPGYLGSLNAYVSKKSPDSKNRYGITGNTFVAVVEFGKELKAKTILTGGASSDPASPHFTDQVDGYINHQYKDIFFYKKDVLKNAEKTYHPGE
ncbi:penicillin acylase family protein [Dyadobacter subterraneus]|uniref:Penicillin acylase family protein n=1 Tax=Dyadobacter subterraneus TaxID=2773304 RepID=A0ABR9WBJ8_9BACT|nr:penicillin acylase family protein [Dyadobacter subterraneus]MBE9462832.1 penicillin acylase family protein [Dyadobacter subterraneus]